MSVAALSAGPEPARIVLREGRLTWTARPPVVPRRTGPERVHLVQVGGGPLGGDHLRLEIDVGAGQSLRVRTAAATVVQPGRDEAAASSTVLARLGPGAVLDWRPEPTVVTDGADWTVRLVVEAAGDARLVLAEQLVLGRHGQRGGSCRSDLDVRVGGVPCVVTSTRIDGADPAASGPGGSGGARSVATLVAVGTGSVLPGGEAVAVGTGSVLPDGEAVGRRVRAGWTTLETGGAMFAAVGGTRDVGAALGDAHRWASVACRPGGVACGG